MSKGYIYIFTNPSFPDYVKIGYTKNVEQRLKDANSTTWTPFAFRCYAYYETEASNADKMIHDMIEAYNPSLKATDTVNGKLRKREFFKLSAEIAYDTLEKIAMISNTTDKLIKNEQWTTEELAEDIETIEKEVSSKSKRFNFSKYGIPADSKLTFKYNNKIFAIVKENNNVDYNGEEYSLSKLAGILLKNKGYNWKQYQGPAFFCYEGRTLADIKKEKE